MEKRIFYTADLIESDGSDTGIYGDGCEPGSGQTLTTGWWDPDWSRYAVCEEREHVRPDVYVDERDKFDDEPSPAQWLAERLAERLGAIERHSVENWQEDGGSAIYACEADRHPYEGKSVRPAAHPEGFAAEEYAEAFRILADNKCLF